MLSNDIFVLCKLSCLHSLAHPTFATTIHSAVLQVKEGQM